MKKTWRGQTIEYDPYPPVTAPTKPPAPTGPEHESIDWQQVGVETYAKPNAERWVRHNARQARCFARLLLRRLLKLTVTLAFVFYVSASVIHLSNDWSLEKLPQLLAKDTRVLLTESWWKDMPLLWRFLDRKPALWE